MAAGVPLLLGTALPSKAFVTVTVKGLPYAVEAKRTTLANYQSLLEQQPWFGNEALAQEFARAVGDQLGYLNSYTVGYAPLGVSFASTYGPVFLYQGSYPVPTTTSWGATVFGPQDSFPPAITDPASFLTTYGTLYQATISYRNKVITYNGPLDRWEFFGVNSPEGDYIATVRQIPASAPAPLPFFGALSAFGFSRRLRKRLRTVRND